MSSLRHKKRDFSLLLVLGILLLISFTIDEVFDHIKAIVRNSRNANIVSIAPASHYPGSRANSATTKSADYASHTAENHSASTGLKGLAALERSQIEAHNQRMRSRNRQKQSTGWNPIEPMPSNPSRFFPELSPPRLSSGIALSTGPDEVHTGDTLIENKWGKGNEVPEKIRENRWGMGTAQAAPTSAPKNAPPSIVFQPPKARPTEQVRTEKLIEVCGRMVPESKAATISMECAPQPAAEPERKPASENLENAGEIKIYLP